MSGGGSGTPAERARGNAPTECVSRRISAVFVEVVVFRFPVGKSHGDRTIWLNLRQIIRVTHSIVVWYSGLRRNRGQKSAREGRRTRPEKVISSRACLRRRSRTKSCGDSSLRCSRTRGARFGARSSRAISCRRPSSFLCFNNKFGRIAFYGSRSPGASVLVVLRGSNRAEKILDKGKAGGVDRGEPKGANPTS